MVECACAGTLLEKSPMKRPFLIFACVLLFSGPATSENSTGLTGRYQITPEKDGFTRLDTATGALSHCGKQDGIWRCAVLAEARSDPGRDFILLRDEAASLNAEIVRLSERLAEIEQRLDSSNPAPNVAGDSLTFAERAMQRFVKMIKTLKNENTG
jgi:hypothetical protein